MPGTRKEWDNIPNEEKCRATFEELLIKIIIGDPINCNSAASLSHFVRLFCALDISLHIYGLHLFHGRPREENYLEVH